MRRSSTLATVKRTLDSLAMVDSPTAHQVDLFRFCVETLAAAETTSAKPELQERVARLETALATRRLVS